MRNHELKLDRALHHIQSLEAEVEWWLGGNPYLLTHEFDAQRGENIVQVQPLYPPPNELGLIIGDCLHNLRSALDALAYELAIVHTRNQLSAKEAERSEFPIFWERPMSASERKRKIGCISDSAQTVIDELQPHHRGEDFTSHPLWLLHELSRIDKHRLPHLTLFVYRAIGFSGEKLYAPLGGSQRCFHN